MREGVMAFVDEKSNAEEGGSGASSVESLDTKSDGRKQRLEKTIHLVWYVWFGLIASLTVAAFFSVSINPYYFDDLASRVLQGIPMFIIYDGLPYIHTLELFGYLSWMMVVLSIPLIVLHIIYLQYVNENNAYIRIKKQVGNMSVFQWLKVMVGIFFIVLILLYELCKTMRIFTPIQVKSSGEFLFNFIISSLSLHNFFLVFSGFFLYLLARLKK